MIEVQAREEYLGENGRVHSGLVTPALIDEEQYLPSAITAEEAYTLSKHQLEQGMKHLRAALAAKYSFKHKKHLKCSNLPRVFSDEQLKEFFVGWPLKYEEARRRLLRGFFYGGRVGEIDRMELVEGGFVRVDALKKGCRYTYYLPLIEGTEKLFPPYTSNHRYHPNYLAGVFTDRLRILGGGYLQKYDKTEDGRNLGRFSSHSLRRTAGNLVRKHTKEVYKAKMFLRHNPSSHFGVTAVYLDYDVEEMRKDLNETFSELVKELI